MFAEIVSIFTLKRATEIEVDRINGAMCYDVYTCMTIVFIFALLTLKLLGFVDISHFVEAGSNATIYMIFSRMLGRCLQTKDQGTGPCQKVRISSESRVFGPFSHMYGQKTPSKSVCRFDKLNSLLVELRRMFCAPILSTKQLVDDESFLSRLPISLILKLRRCF